MELQSAEQRANRYHASIWLSVLLGEACRCVVDEFQGLFSEIAERNGKLVAPYADFMDVCRDLPEYVFDGDGLVIMMIGNVAEKMWDFLQHVTRHVGNGFAGWELGMQYLMRIMKFFLLHTADPRANRLSNVFVPMLEEAAREMRPYYCSIHGYGYLCRQCTVTEIRAPPYVQKSESLLVILPLLRLFADLLPPTCFLRFKPLIRYSNYGYFYAHHKHIIPTTLKTFLFTNGVLQKHFWGPFFATRRSQLMPMAREDVESRLLAPGSEPLKPGEIVRFKFYEANRLVMFVERRAAENFNGSYNDMPCYYMDEHNAARWWAS